MVAARLIAVFSAVLIGGWVSVCRGVENTDAERPDKRILYISSYDASYRWTNDLLSGFRRYFHDRSLPVTIDTLELNVLNAPGLAPSAREVGRLRGQLSGAAYDLVVAAGNPAADLFFDRVLTLPADLPLVFCGYHGFRATARPPLGNVTGLAMPEVNLRNIELGLQLWPRTRNIVLITDGSSTADQLAAVRLPEVEITLINGRDDTTADLLRKLAGLPDDSFVVFNNWRSSRPEGRELLRSVFEQMAQNRTKSVLMTQDSGFEAGIPGGVMVEGGAHGYEAARLAERVLNGEAAERIPVATGASRPVFDYDLLARYHLTPEMLPADTLLLHPPRSFWSRYKLEIASGLAALIAALLVFIFHLISRQRHSRRLQVIFRALPVRVAAADARGRIHFLQVTDEAAPDFAAETWTLQEFPADIRNTFQEPVRQVLASGQPLTIEYDCRGRRRQAKLLKLSRDIFGVETALWVSTDVEDLHAAQVNMAALAERFRLTLESIGDGVIATDEQEVITLANPVAAELTGLPSEKLLGRKLADCFRTVDPTDGASVPSLVRLVLQDGEGAARPRQTDLVARDGSRRHIAENVALIREAAERIAGAVLVFRDIGEEYEKHNRIMLQNKMLQAAAEVAQMTYFQYDDGCVVEAEPQPEYWGWRDGRRMTVEEWVAPEDRQNFLAAWHRLLQGEDRSLEIAYRVKTGKDCRFFEMMVKPVEIAGQGRVKYFGIIRDITAAREAELQRLDAAMLLQEVMDNLPCYIFAKEVENGFRYVICNRLQEQLFQRPLAEILGKTDFEIVPDRKRAELYRSEDLELVRSGKVLDAMETFVDTQGVKRIGKVVKKLLIKANGDRLLLGMAIDLSREITAEAELKATNSILQAIMDNLPAMIAAKDVQNDFRYIIWNRAAEQLSGIPASEVLGRRADELVCYRDKAEQFRRNDLEVCRSGSVKVADHYEFPNGRVCDLHTLLTKVERPDGGALLLVLSLDVTEEKRLEAERQTLMENLKVYAEQERLLNTSLEAVVLNDDNSSALQHLLDTVGARMAADRCYLFQYDYDQNRVIPVVEWHKPGIPSMIDYLPRPAIREDEDWFRCMQRGELFIVPDLRQGESISQTGSWADHFQQEKIYSLFCVGIRRGGKLWGHLGLTYERQGHQFSDQDAQLFRAAAHIVEIVLERKRNRDKLERSEYEKRLILDTIKIPILLFDPEMRLQRVNNAALKIAGLPEAEVYARPCFGYLCGDDNLSNCPVHLSLQDYREHVRKLRIKERDYLSSAYPIFLDGKLINVLNTLVDVTDFNEVQRQLTDALQDARNADRAKSYFLATMSHELRTPLNAVIGFSELLQEGDIPRQEQEDYLRSINLAGRALLKLINGVLDLSKIEADQLELVPQPTDLAVLLQEIYAIFRHRTEQKGLRFSLQCPADLPLLELDSLRLRQILLNLVGNAVKFTEAGSVDIVVEFQRRAADWGTLLIHVRDTGIGVSREYQEKIFQPFVQQESTRDSRIYEGTGLGLAISQRLAGKMGGVILLESRINCGSDFSLRLDRVAIDVQGPVSPESEPEPERSTTFRRVLVVDDVSMNLKVLAAMLKKLKMEVRSAVSGKEALELLRQEVADVLLTDLWMPGMDGGELARRIRWESAWRKMKLVAVTADTEAKNNFDMSEFDAILLKPVSLEKLKSLFAGLEDN